MRFHQTTTTELLLAPVPGKVIERAGQIVGQLECRNGTLELNREELIAIVTAGRDLLQRVAAAEQRREEGVRPIPAHGQPARPYTPAPMAAMAPMAPTTLQPRPIPPQIGTLPPPRGAHARPVADAAPTEEEVVPGPSPAASAS